MAEAEHHDRAGGGERRWRGERRILHVDMDAFFAAIELLRHPELRGKPVVVGGRGDPMRRGVVSTATYEARKYGIHSGMALRTAYHRCPHAVFLAVDHDAYAEVSSRIKAILRAFSPRVEDAGLDEAYLDLSEVRGSGRRIAAAIKRRIRAETGLVCSVGVAPNKLLAKIASDLDKPDGLTVLTEEDIPRRVWPLPVQRLRGVGPKTAARLAALGVTTIGALAGTALETLQRHFGEAYGRYLHDAARGIDASPVVPYRPVKSISRETTFQHDVGDRMVLVRLLGRLARDVAATAREEGVRARTVTIKLRFADFETHTRQLTLPAPTDAPGPIEEAAVACLGRIALTKKVRLIGVRLSGLVAAPGALEATVPRLPWPEEGAAHGVPPTKGS